MSQEKLMKEVKAMKLIVLGSCISQMGTLYLVDDTKFELKQKVNRLNKASIDIENWFKFHPNTTKETLEVFTQKFKEDELIMLGEINMLLYGISYEGLEVILDALRRAVTVDNTTPINNSL